MLMENSKRSPDYPSETSNFRPVLLLSCVGKMMKRIVNNNLLYKYQAGFLPGHL